MAHNLDTAPMDAATYFGEPHTRQRSWLEICRDPRLLDAIESLIGPNIVLVYSSFFVKPADGLDANGNEAQVAWHQDNNYWAAVHGTEGVITVWLAVDDADVANGTMKLLPGTHRPYVDLDSGQAPPGSIVSRQVDVGPELEATAVPLILPAGSVSIHDSYLLHGSGYNRSGRRRAAYTIRYLAADKGHVDVSAHPVPAYIVRGCPAASGGGYIDARPGTPLPRLFTSTEEYQAYANRNSKL